MPERETIKRLIRRAFADTPRPPNDALRNSSQGDEPYLLEEEFADKLDWRDLEAEFLDQSPDGFATALNFFSGEAFRYFLPAYLIADLNDRLDRVDPAFHLWHGLDDATASEVVNPLLYGERTWRDVVSERFAGFAELEVEAIVAYLRFKAAHDDFTRTNILQALSNYWLPRLGLGKS